MWCTKGDESELQAGVDPSILYHSRTTMPPNSRKTFSCSLYWSQPKSFFPPDLKCPSTSRLHFVLPISTCKWIKGSGVGKNQVLGLLLPTLETQAKILALGYGLVASVVSGEGINWLEIDPFFKLKASFQCAFSSQPAFKLPQRNNWSHFSSTHTKTGIEEQPSHTLLMCNCFQRPGHHCSPPLKGLNGIQN